MPHDEPSPNVEGKRQRRRRRRLKFEPKRWLKSCVRIFFKPIRRASARQAVLTLIIYCIIISLGTYYTQLLDDIHLAFLVLDLTPDFFLFGIRLHLGNNSFQNVMTFFIFIIFLSQSGVID